MTLGGHVKDGWVYGLAVLAVSVENRREQDSNSCLKELGLHRNVLFLFLKKSGGEYYFWMAGMWTFIICPFWLLSNFSSAVNFLCAQPHALLQHWHEHWQRWTH